MKKLQLTDTQSGLSVKLASTTNTKSCHHILGLRVSIGIHTYHPENGSVRLVKEANTDRPRIIARSRDSVGGNTCP